MRWLCNGDNLSTKTIGSKSGPAKDHVNKNKLAISPRTQYGRISPRVDPHALFACSFKNTSSNSSLLERRLQAGVGYREDTLRGIIQKGSKHERNPCIPELEHIRLECARQISWKVHEKVGNTKKKLVHRLEHSQTEDRARLNHVQL